MGRPTIKDEDRLLEIGVLHARFPEEKHFSKIYERLPEDMRTGAGVPDSVRSRLQGKFNADRDYWLQRGIDELHNRRIAAAVETVERLQQRAGEVVEAMRPQVEAAQRFVDNMAPSLLAAQRAANGLLNSPKLRNAIRNYERVSGKKL